MTIRSVKLYRIATDISFEQLHEKLIHLDVTDTSGDTPLRFYTKNFKSSPNDDHLLGDIYYDEQFMVVTTTGPLFYKTEQSLNFCLLTNTHLMLFANKIISDKIANKLDELLFPKQRNIILENPFEDDMFQQFLDANPHITGTAFMSGILTPGANSDTIFGSDVEKSILYQQAKRLGGKPNFIRFNLNNEGITIGLSKKGVVVFYSDMTDDEVIHFIKEKILPFV
jgi:hypothetical protein